MKYSKIAFTVLFFFYIELRLLDLFRVGKKGSQLSNSISIMILNIDHKS